jgi:predicted site-specific integrase-resolvase
MKLIDVALLTGYSYVTLRKWIRLGYIKPTKVRKARRFYYELSTNDVQAIQAHGKRRWWKNEQTTEVD